MISPAVAWGGAEASRSGTEQHCGSPQEAEQVQRRRSGLLLEKESSDHLMGKKLSCHLLEKESSGHLKNTIWGNNNHTGTSLGMERYSGGHLGRSCNKGRLKCCQNATLPNNIIATTDFELRVKLSWFSGNIQATKRVQPPRLLQVNLYLLQTKFWFEISISAGQSVLW